MKTRVVLGLFLGLSLSACAPQVPNSGPGIVDASTPVRPTEVSGGFAPGSTQAGDGTVVANAAGISAENDFDAVSGQRDIEADAALIARNRAEYLVVQPTDVPARSSNGQPNIVSYALRTSNPVGVKVYRRSIFPRPERTQAACAAFASADLAQVAFLANGGPERDKLRVDPDGDGFACDWSPETFRALAAK